MISLDTNLPIRGGSQKKRSQMARPSASVSVDHGLTLGAPWSPSELRRAWTSVVHWKCVHTRRMVLTRIPKRKPEVAVRSLRIWSNIHFGWFIPIFFWLHPPLSSKKWIFCCLKPTTRMAPVAILHISHRLWSELHRWWCYLLCDFARQPMALENHATVPFWLVFDFFTGDKQ